MRGGGSAPLAGGAFLTWRRCHLAAVEPAWPPSCGAWSWRLTFASCVSVSPWTWEAAALLTRLRGGRPGPSLPGASELPAILEILLSRMLHRFHPEKVQTWLQPIVRAPANPQRGQLCRGPRPAHRTEVATCVDLPPWEEGASAPVGPPPGGCVGRVCCFLRWHSPPKIPINVGYVGRGQWPWTG